MIGWASHPPRPPVRPRAATRDSRPDGAERLGGPSRSRARIRSVGGSATSPTRRSGSRHSKSRACGPRADSRANRRRRRAMTVAIGSREPRRHIERCGSDLRAQDSRGTVRFAWSVAFGPVNMSRMRKDRGDARIDGRAERRLSGLQIERPGPSGEADFERAFVDALRDILMHERRRAA
jgi:hypothetical protein